MFFMHIFYICSITTRKMRMSDEFLLWKINIVLLNISISDKILKLCQYVLHSIVLETKI